MRSFTSNSDVWRVGAVLLLVLVAANALLYAVFHRRAYQQMAVEALSPSTELLALGSSRVIFGFDPRAYSVPAVGLPANYLDLVHSERLFAMYGPRLAKLKVALIEFDTATLRYDTDVMNPYGYFDLGFSRIPALDEWLSHFDRAAHKLLAPVFNWRLTPEFMALEKIQFEGFEPTAAVPGHIPSTVTMPFPASYAETEVASTAKELAAMPPAILERNLAAAARLVGSVRAAGVTPILIRFPHEPSLRQVYPKAWSALVAKAHADLEEALGTGVELWDFTEDPRFLTEHFRDPDHLNQKGAALLATVLGERLGGRLSR